MSCCCTDELPLTTRDACKKRIPVVNNRERFFFLLFTICLHAACASSSSSANALLASQDSCSRARFPLEMMMRRERTGVRREREESTRFFLSFSLSHLIHEFRLRSSVCLSLTTASDASVKERERDAPLAAVVKRGARQT